MLVRYRMFPTILVAGVLAGCAAGPARSPAQEEADAVATGRVYAALDANRIYYFRDVDVRVSNGVARLSGYVWSADALYCAEKVRAAFRASPGSQTRCNWSAQWQEVAVTAAADTRAWRARGSVGRDSVALILAALAVVSCSSTPERPTMEGNRQGARAPCLRGA